MAIRIIEGVPGSGKTYFAVHHLLTKYFDYDKNLSEWIKKDEFKNLVLVTNIDGFPFSTPLQKLIDQAGSLEAFFTYEYQEALSNGTPYVYLIDESQSYFPYTYRDTRVFLFFQKHRHLGMDIYLITQDADHMAKGMRSLAEYHIVASRRSLSMMGELRYRFVDPQTRDCWQTKTLKKDGKIYSFYTSFNGLETEKSPSIPRKFLLYTSLGLLVIFVGGYFGIYKRLTSRDSLSVANTNPQASARKNSPSLFHPESAAVGVVQPTFPGANNSSSAGPTSSYGLVVGTFDVDGKTHFLLDIKSVQLRLTQDEMTRICKCHADQVGTSQAYAIDENTAPASVRWAIAAGGAGSQAPRLPGGKVGT